MNAFFKNNGFQFAVENALSDAYYRASDVGEVLATIAHGALHARRGDDVAAVRFLSGAREQNRRAAMRWPTRPETPAILEEAARRLGAASYEEAWRAGRGLTLADVVRPRRPRPADNR
jgi:hypothetical protein